MKLRPKEFVIVCDAVIALPEVYQFIVYAVQIIINSE
jgi:hypothetical protein